MKKLTMKMDECGVKMDERIYAVIMSICLGCGRLEDMWRYYDDMILVRGIKCHDIVLCAMVKDGFKYFERSRQGDSEEFLRKWKDEVVRHKVTKTKETLAWERKFEMNL